MGADRRDHVSTVLALLRRADPYGLASGTEGGAPVDELMAEAREISAIAMQRRVTRGDVDDVWLRWFGETFTTAVGEAPAAELVQRVNDLRDTARAARA